MPLNSDQLKFFADYIESKLGIVYTKDSYYQLEKRLDDISQVLKVSTVEQLWQMAQSGIAGQLKDLLLDMATNNETSFFRDPGLFSAIENKILSDPVYSSENPPPIRIWSCATSTGQEVYSMAILLNAWMRMHPRRSFSFLATDYSPRVLSQASAGIYSELEVQRGLSPTYRDRFFYHDPAAGTVANWRVRDELKRNIQFKQLNLLEDFGLIGPFEFVLCRNVLIYQNVESKRKIIAQIAKRIAPKGFLVLGAAESLMGLSDEFELRQIDKAVVYQKKG